MSLPPTVLTDKSPKSPNVREFFWSMLSPAMLIGMVFMYGLPGAVWEQASSLNPYKILSIFKWRDSIWGIGGAKLLAIAEARDANARRMYLGDAYGKVLEVGAGSGELIKYYDETKIERLYALEPFPALVKRLREKVTARGPTFEAKTTIVAKGVEDKVTLSKKYGVNAQSIDTLVLVQCLCSIPEPKKHLRECVDLLKPGGKLILIEHVSSVHPTTRLFQDILTPLWRFLFNGCEINRDTIASLKALQCWDDIRIERPDSQTTAEMVPHVWIRATRKR